MLLLLLVLCLGANLAMAADRPELREAVLEVRSIGIPGEMMVVLRGPDGQFLMEEGDFAKLRLKPPSTSPTLYEGRRYFDPRGIPGCELQIDENLQLATVTPPAAAMDTTHLSNAPRQHPDITPASPGAFLNYQVSAQQINSQNIGGAFAELGLFAGAGVLTNSAVARYGGPAGAGNNEVLRLETTYTRDFPDSLDTLNVGDAISDGGSWGNAVRYAGVRFSRNFGLRPDLLTTPLLATSGTATVPSTVDVFVNNQLVTSNQLPAGPFVIDRLPTVSGTGAVSVVVRDALGREQVLTQSFYSSTVLLAHGLSQYSVNVGSIRDDYALANNRYGGFLSELSYRRGITDAITLEGHGEYLSGDAHAAGLNAAFALGKFGVMNFTAAAGGAPGGSGVPIGVGVPSSFGVPAGSGVLGGAGFERRDTHASFIVNSQWASRGFAQVGEPADPALRIRQRTLLQTGRALGRFGSMSLAYVLQTYRDSPSQQTLSLTDSVSFGRFGNLNFTVSRTHTAAAFPTAAQDSTSAYLIFTVPFDARRAATLTSVGGSGVGGPPSEVIASVTQSPPVGPGSGYRFSASTAGDYDADWRQQFRGADLEVEAARNQGLDGRSANLTGAMTFLDGQLNTSRTISGSFAMVDVAGVPDVPVYVENQLTTHTDASGRALLYNLRPYEANKISITPEDLPLDTVIAATAAIMAPPYRSGVVARFPVERVRGGTFRLVTEDGNPVPVGALVKLKGELFPVVKDGVVYVTGYDHGMGAEATWKGGRCSFRLEPPPPDEPVPDMGTVRCHTVQTDDLTVTRP